MTFGQEVKLGDNGDEGKYKVDPAIVSGLYADWVIPLTKEVEIDYLLRRLNWNHIDIGCWCYLPNKDHSCDKTAF